MTNPLSEGEEAMTEPPLSDGGENAHHNIVAWLLSKGEAELRAHLPNDQAELAVIRFRKIRLKLSECYPDHEQHLRL